MSLSSTHPPRGLGEANSYPPPPVAHHPSQWIPPSWMRNFPTGIPTLGVGSNGYNTRPKRKRKEHRLIPRPCKSFITSTRPHLASLTNSAMFFTERTTCDVLQTFKRTISCGLLTISTRYAAAWPFPILHSGQHRLSMVWILPALLTGNAYANSERYAALGLYSQHPTHSRLVVSRLPPNRSTQGVMVMCMSAPSTAPEFASNVCGCTLGMVQRRLRRRAFSAVDSPICDH